MMQTITLRELSGKNPLTKTTVMRRKPDETDAALIQRAVAKLWGSRCFWFQDNGLGLFYGQVFESLGNQQNTSRTSRARVDITPGA